MLTCLECGVAIPTSRKFCTRSCAATYNNRKYPKRSRKQSYYCQFCGTKLVAPNKMYCNNQCQVALRKQELIENWLKYGATHIRNDAIRDYILKDQDGRCDICYIEPIWNNKPLIFIMDHIDGNADNNFRNNLRLICSNCDSQLNTYKAKNKGKGRYSRRLRYQNGQSA